MKKIKEKIIVCLILLNLCFYFLLLATTNRMIELQTENYELWAEIDKYGTSQEENF